MTSNYTTFLSTKLSYAASVGLPVRTVPERLFPFQRQVTTWAIERGRAAVWLDTGLGKTACQLVYAQHVAEQAGDVLILAPLAVAQQTVREGTLMGIPVTLCRTQVDVRPGINITNYERLHHFDVTRMAGVVLDESSILKAFDGKTRTQLIEAFRQTPYKLCCTATPSPNDYMELGNHCLPFHSVIVTREGNREIGDIVRSRDPVEVLSFDGEKLVWRHVTDWKKHPNSERLWRIQWARGGRGATLSSTPNHPVLTRSGWMQASKIEPGDEVAIATPTLSPDQEEIIYGTLLGDSWLRVYGGGWPSLCSCHSKPQWDYLDWLADAFDTKAFDTTARPGGFIRGRQINGQAQRRLRTKQSHNLWPVFRLAYPDGTKRVTREWLDRIGPLGLAVWAMDDGTTRVIPRTREVRSCECKRGQHKKLCSVRGPRETVNGYHFVFNTDGFSLDERAIIITWLKERFDLDVTASGGRKIALTMGSTRHFREIVAPYMILGDHEKQWRFPLVSHESREDIMWMPVTSSCPDPKNERTWYVHDITVEGTHNFVMASGLVVHNSEFLGVMSRNEMLATYFTHDGGNTSQWRLKKHAEQLFWRWVASWAFALTHPKLIGDTTPGYDLPPLKRHVHPVTIDTAHTGLMLFPMEVSSLSEQRTAKRAGLEARVRAAVETIQREPDEPWLVWTELNDEANAITKALPGAVQIAGRDSADAKEKRLVSFCTGETRILVSKASICGFGLNLQFCARMCFVGINNSFESWYQSVRRCWRFGQARPVDVHIFYLHIEAPILRNLSRKEAEAARMHHLMTQAILEHHQWQIPVQPYEPKGEMVVPAWLTENIERANDAERD